MNEADFSGYATRNNLRCSDGRTILADAFKHNDGQIVPLVWQHGHEDPTNVLGHVKLENVQDGVKAYAFFNATAKAQHAKEMVRHGDVKFLSIFANQLVEKLKDGLKAVVHGNIREVSLVLAGANPGATIENVAIAHADGDVEVFDDEALITTGLELDLQLVHADASTSTTAAPAAGDTRSLQDVVDTLNEEQRTALDFLVSQALTVGSAVQHSDTDDEGDGDSAEADADDSAAADGSDVVTETAGTEGDAEADEADAEAGSEEDSEDVDAEASDSDSESDDESSDGATSEGDAAADTEDGAGEDAVQHDNINQEDNSMSHNVFDQAQGGTAGHKQVTLSHDDVKSIISATVKHGSMKEAVEEFVTKNGVMVDGTLQHGIENIDYLFPDAKLLETSPQFLARRMEWVDKVLGSVRKSPFSRVKTVVADITEDEARARGYIKGNQKAEEFFKLIKRETTPQTIYKKQKLDRDDVLDIVDLDVVAWMRAEMKVMLDEELAGAILIGDGRSAGDDDKIREDKIRPIASDDELYVTTVNVNLDDSNSNADELVDAVIANRKYYKGTGSPTFFTTEDIISAFLTVKDNFGRRIYTTLADVQAVLRVSEIVPVEIFDRVPDVVGIMVNLTDYTLGADRGGQATMFDDFDLDFNKLKYLIETRCSGALTMVKSAIVFRKQAAANVQIAQPTEPAFADNVVTVPTVTGVTYKNADTNATLTTGAPVTLTVGQTLHVKAFAAAGKYFPNNAEDEWIYEYEA
jgi:HK97 family phage prohead protease